MEAPPGTAGQPPTLPSGGGFTPTQGRGPPFDRSREGYRTFSVARPIIARMREMIQKRMTMVLSAQPFFS